MPQVTEYARRFAAVWNTTLRSGGRVADVAAELGCTPKTAIENAARMRRLGYRLGRFKSGPIPKRKSPR